VQALLSSRERILTASRKSIIKTLTLLHRELFGITSINFNLVLNQSNFTLRPLTPREARENYFYKARLGNDALRVTAATYRYTTILLQVADSTCRLPPEFQTSRSNNEPGFLLLLKPDFRYFSIWTGAPEDRHWKLELPGIHQQPTAAHDFLLKVRISKVKTSPLARSQCAVCFYIHVQVVLSSFQVTMVTWCSDGVQE